MSSVLSRANSQGGIEWNWQDTQPFGNTKNEGSENVTTQWNTTDPADPKYVSKVYAKQYILAADEGVALDLAHGTLKDFAGNPLAFTKLKSLHVRVVSGGTTGAVKINVDPAGGTGTETQSPNFLDNSQDGGGETWDTTGLPIAKPIYPGGQYQDDNPKGWPINLTTDIIGFSLLNSTGGPAVVNVSFLGV